MLLKLVVDLIDFLLITLVYFYKECSRCKASIYELKKAYKLKDNYSAFVDKSEIRYN